ncbi:MAG: ABC transporter ATP-binding protein [Proteobacteria bacterium]|nr:ABC transporter ATP-binding protein [Pseudomonadota bacterium]MDA0927656.1 ABC transporter ATP-binding protein [Pseudomonadota bacterium]
MLEIEQLTKNYRDFSLGPVNLSVEAGCALGLVGANGSGKTTLFRSLMGTVRTDDGKVIVAGNEATPDKGGWKEHIGYVGDYAPFFDSWTGEKNLMNLGRFYRNWSMDTAHELASRLRLDLGKRVRQYSTGNRTKLAIVSALSRKATLLILDEPSNGLDPVARDSFMDILHEQLESGEIALLYATHHISEIEVLADRLVFLSDGTVVRDVIKEDLIEAWRRFTFRKEVLPENIPNVVSQRSEHPYHELTSDNGKITESFLHEQRVEQLESSIVSIEKIAVEILKSSAKEMNHA